MNISFQPLERRQLLSGTPVAAFGTSGTATAELNPHSYSYNALDVATDPYGRTIIGATYTAHDQFSLTRLTAAGAMDYTFSGDSHVVQSVPDANAPIVGAHVFQIAVDHAGRTLVLADGTLYRYAVNGKADTTFGNQGSETIPVFSRAVDLTVDARNRPIVVGTSTGVTGTRATVIRLGITGALDTSFGSGGAYKRPVPQDATFQQPGDGAGLSVVVQSSGQVLAAASVRYQYDNDDSRDYTNGTELFRLTATGALDSSYGKKGHLEFDGRDDDVNGGAAYLNALLPSGSAVIEQVTSSFDSPTPIGSRNFSYVNAAGVTTGTALTLRPKTTAYPKSQFVDNHVIGEDAAGRIILESDGVVYRLNPKTFKYDSDFGFISDTATAALPIGTMAVELFSRTTIGSSNAPGVELRQITA